MTSFITRRSARVYQQISGIFREIGKEKRLKNAQESKTRFLSMLFIYFFRRYIFRKPVPVAARSKA